MKRGAGLKDEEEEGLPGGSAPLVCPPIAASSVARQGFAGVQAARRSRLARVVSDGFLACERGTGYAVSLAPFPSCGPALGVRMRAGRDSRDALLAGWDSRACAGGRA